MINIIQKHAVKHIKIIAYNLKMYVSLFHV
jgi:hypothetical protein